jgi:hypothetical protein
MKKTLISGLASKVLYYSEISRYISLLENIVSNTSLPNDYKVKKKLEGNLNKKTQYEYVPHISSVKIFILTKRFRDTTNSFNASAKRYVITNPPYNFKLLPTDQVFEHKISNM